MSKKTDRLYKEYWDTEKVEVETFLDGNFSVVLLTHAKAGHVIGASKRNPNCDEYIPSRGVDIATTRALENLDKKLHPARYKKVKK